MSLTLYLRVLSDRFKPHEVESMVQAVADEVRWIDERTLKADLDEYKKVQLKLMFPSIQHDLGISLCGIVGFDSDLLMSHFLDVTAEHKTGKLSGAHETLILSCRLNNFDLIRRLDRIFENVDRDAMETARMYLDTGRNVNASAKHLYLHRNTFRYRLNKFIRQTSLDIRENEQGKLMETWYILSSIE